MSVLMALPQPPKIILALATCLCLLADAQAQASLQTGRAANGSLWITDQALPNGITSTPIAHESLLTLPPGPKTSQPPEPDRNVAATQPTAHKLTAEEQATCQSINNRYNEARNTLAKTEKAKASGQLLIPESGLMSMRQNLSTLERMRSLCL